jgi:pilus assembly protein Flp/PilA
MSLIHNIIQDESGASSIEYSLIAALIALAIIGAVTVVGSNLKSSFFDGVSNNLPT